MQSHKSLLLFKTHVTKKNKSLICKQTLAEEDNIAIYNTIQHDKTCIYSENLSHPLVYTFFYKSSDIYLLSVSSYLESWDGLFSKVKLHES